MQESNQRGGAGRLPGRGLLLLGGLLALLACSGCRLKLEMPELIKATPTPAPTPAPTATPLPTAPAPTATMTPAPRQIGSKTGSAGRVQFTNSTGKRFRQVYLQAQGGEGWGRNLLPSESSIHVNENFVLYYPQAGGGLFNFLFQDEKGVQFELRSIPVTDMSAATLEYDKAEGDVYLLYQSLSDQTQKDTRKTSSHQGGDEEDEDEDEDYYGEDEEDEYLYDFDEEEESSDSKKKKSSKKDEEAEDEEEYDFDEDFDDGEEYFDIDSEDYYYYNPDEDDWDDEDWDYEG